MGTNKTCSYCGKTFVLGKTGVITDDLRFGCDSCLHIERDNTPDHSVWYPTENEQIRCDIYGENEFVITRSQAFGNPPFPCY